MGRLLIGITTLMAGTFIGVTTSVAYQLYQRTKTLRYEDPSMSFEEAMDQARDELIEYVESKDISESDIKEVRKKYVQDIGDKIVDDVKAMAQRPGGQLSVDDIQDALAHNDIFMPNEELMIDIAFYLQSEHDDLAKEKVDTGETPGLANLLRN